ncbi:sensor histidine kinase [Priestia taiwanensis]|uniref:histidine kinase n=1 Tax=Priestia taiwanensis TaxID=1347902 RepID=A0A917AVT0_9BACI|nr:sensor histidine kinase [Priestia taiwanensis]MBM7363538.1 signal transduction histidine kinase [Priestia taiwanensis]GGE76298.1 sensor histidine kinase [Priestia taiwanensis]
MRLFIRDHLSFFALYVCNFGLLFVLYHIIDGFRTNVMYFLVVSFFLFTCFLTYRYMSNRRMYQILSNEPTRPEDILLRYSYTPLSTSFEQLLKQQYRLFQQEIQEYEIRQDEHQMFINQWVHQMKTPLSVIQLILQEHEDEPHIEKMKQEVEKLHNGLNTALYMARLDTFHHDFRAESVLVKPLVKKNINELKELFIRKRVFPSIDIADDLTVPSDAKWLTFIIHQLLTNAIRYSGEGNKKVYIRAYPYREHTVLEVRDEGVGIPKADINRVFDPFYTGENGRRFGESTGMGLYIIKSVCEKLGHQIELTSKIGEGTTVKITFY